MPEPWTLQRLCRDGQVFVFRGPHLFTQYDEDDLGMRNLAVVALTDAGFSVNEVAACFSLSRQYVSMLRGRARDVGSAGLVRPRGRRASLSPAKWVRALQLSDAGVTDVEIARRFGVHCGTVGRQLARLRAERRLAEPQRLEPDDGEAVDGEAVGDADQQQDEGEDPTGTAAEPAGGPRRPETLARLVGSTVTSRYAGAMLLHPFLSRLGADDVLSSLPAVAARRYDATSLVLGSAFGFVLGISSLEGAKHLRVADAGALVGLSSFPHLRTLRPRLASLAEACDPLAVQRVFAKAMLAADEAPPELFYVDDHFVTYWGSRPVQKGYNIRRHLAEPGRDDTFVVDERWRAICFSSGEPRGLSVSMGEVIAQLTEITNGSPVMVGFDRGGSYPKVFHELAGAGMEWVTWRRAPLVNPTVAPRRSWFQRDGARHYLSIADEIVELPGYDAGAVRQLSAYEDGKVAFQVLTSNTSLRPAPLVHKLRHRWCIENFNKYVEAHQGVHWLTTYEMQTEPNTAMVANPAGRTARAERTRAKAAVAEAERFLGQAMDASYESVDERVAVIGTRRDDVAIAKDALIEAGATLKGIPAKLAANALDPNAQRAKPRLSARALQMVCRLLAYNAELDLARRLDAYLDDPDEYRAITRNLLHLGGTINYERKRIVVNLDRPDSPRVARALGLLIEELDADPTVRLAGDSRPITYKIVPL